ncbi:hypothetical protein BW33_02260 [Pseudomonas sp. RIT288]|nr:hypothetical protein BW33_02260 [Pseudomonas sp. RIT288]
MLPLLFATRLIDVAAQPRAIKVDSRQRTALDVVEIERAVVRQTLALELAAGVIRITQGAPALMLGDQPILQVVFEGQWMFLTVIDPGQTAQSVVGVSHLNPVGQGLEQQTPGRITRVSGDQRRAVITELGLFQQVPVAVVGVSGAPTIEAGFLSDQSGGRVVQSVLFPGFVLDFRQQQLRMVVAILHPRAVGVDLARDPMQVVVILVAGDAPELVALGSDLAVGAVAVGTGGAARQRRLQQPANGVPLLMGDRTVFVASGRPAPQRIVGKAPHSTVGQGFLDQLAEVVP